MHADVNVDKLLVTYILSISLSFCLFHLAPAGPRYSSGRGGEGPQHDAVTESRNRSSLRCCAILDSPEPRKFFRFFSVVGTFVTAEYGLVLGTEYGFTLAHLCRMCSDYGEGG